MRFERRVRALESKMLADPVILYLPDGTTRQICGRSDFLLRLFYAACGGADLSPVQAAAVDLIRRSVAAQEPGGGRMIELVRCALHTPGEEPSSMTPVR